MYISIYNLYRRNPLKIINSYFSAFTLCHIIDKLCPFDHKLGFYSLHPFNTPLTFVGWRPDTSKQSHTFFNSSHSAEHGSKYA